MIRAATFERFLLAALSITASAQAAPVIYDFSGPLFLQPPVPLAFTFAAPDFIDPPPGLGVLFGACWDIPQGCFRVGVRPPTVMPIGTILLP